MNDDLDSEWARKGATLSNKTAREEFGLAQDDIIRAIRAGTLQYREGSMYGNPWLRLLQREVEALVKDARRRLPEGSAGEDGAGAHQPRAKAAEDPDRPIGRTQVQAERRPREMTSPDP